ncbi:MAG: type II toxin-antitoxin system HicB family antitoxin [Nitrospira sp.]
MTYYTFEIVVEKETDDVGYLAYSPTLPGCFSNGKTIEEAKRNIREAIQQHLQSLLAHHQPVPQNEKLVHVEELTVAVLDAADAASHGSGIDSISQITRVC